MIGTKRAPHEDSGLGTVRIPDEIRRRGEGPVMDHDSYGHLEPVGFNALEMLRCVEDYTKAKMADERAGVVFDKEKYWRELIAREGETPNARWSEHFYFAGGLYEREPSDTNGGFIGSITMGPGYGEDVEAEQRAATDKHRAFDHYYGQTKMKEYWDRKGSCLGARCSWIFKRFEMPIDTVYRLLMTDAVFHDSPARTMPMTTYCAAAHAHGQEGSDMVYPLQLAALAWQPGTYIPMDYLVYELPGGIVCYDGISIDVGHIFATGGAAAGRAGRSDVEPSVLPKDLRPFTDNTKLVSIEKAPVDFFFSLDNVHN